MQARLLGYLLNALDEEEARCVEEMLAASEAARRQLELLRHALLPLGGRPRHDDPPQDLAARTCQRVRENRQTDSGS
jgi:anti-sigma-K factor RskA